MQDLVQTIIVCTGTLIVILVTIALATSFAIALFGGGPFVPTPKKAVKEILKHAKIKKGDKLYDIGAGDGRFLHYAEKLYGAKATGFEIDPFVYAIARLKQILFRWKGKIIRGNFQKHPLNDADIVICYMLPKTLKKYQKKFDRELKKSCKVISYTFHIGNWKPIREISPSKGVKKIFIYSKATSSASSKAASSAHSTRDNPAKTRTKKKIKSKTT